MSALNQVIASFKSGPASMVVSGAGTAAANSTYTYTGQSTTKNYYNKSGSSATVNAISWDGSNWKIYDSGGGFLYYSTDNVATPNLVTTWILWTGANPLPTVTQA